MATPLDSKRALHFKTIIFSDTHLGKKAASAAFLFEFLQNVSCDRLIMNGDILEGWGMKRKNHAPFPEMHARCLDAINATAAAGTEVIYLRGNHDEDLTRSKRKLSGRTILFRDKQREHESPIRFQKSFQHEDARGRRFLVLHGDVFDGFMKSSKKKVIAQYADHAYEGLVHLNGLFRDAVHDLTGVQVSPMAFAKRNLKAVLGIIREFSQAVSSKQVVSQFDGVICGHIHHAEITQKEDVLYMNSGDWVEGTTALAEDANGNWHIVEWGKKRVEIGVRRVPTVLDHNPFEAFRGITERQLGLARRWLWPGTDYSELRQKLWQMSGKLRGQNEKLASLFAQETEEHDSRKEEKALRKKIGALEQGIGDLRDQLTAVRRFER